MGDAVVIIECGGVYEEAGATAYDICDGDVPAGIVIGGNSVDTSVPGRYLVAYDVQDGAMNNGRAVRAIDVLDTIQPEIVLFGEEAVSLQCGELYGEAGLDSVIDICEGDMFALIDPEYVAVTIWDAAQALYTSNLLYIESAFDTTTGYVPGEYTLVYEIADSSENTGVAERQIDIADTLPPEIVLNGDSSVVVECGDTYTDTGATAADLCDGDLTASINTNHGYRRSGSICETYTVSDTAANNAVEVTRTVTVTDTTAPCNHAA